MLAMIMNYLNNIYHFSPDKNELKNSGILSDLIYLTIISMIDTCYLNFCNSIIKSPDSLEIYLSN